MDVPGARQLEGRVARGRVAAAHAADDVGGEGDPDLLVVVELGVVPQALASGDPRLVVARRIERQPVALARRR